MGQLWLEVGIFAAVSMFSGIVLWILFLLLRSDQPIAPPKRLELRSHSLGQPNEFDRAFTRLIVESGYTLSPALAMLLLLGCSFLAGVAMFVILEKLSVAFIASIVVGSLLICLLLWQRIRHQQLVQSQLPSVIEMLARSVRAGESLEQALRSVATQTPPPLAADLRRAVQKLDLGLGLPETIHQLDDRYRMIDMRMFTSAVAVHRLSGGDLPKALERLALVLQDRLNYRRRLRSMVASARFAALLIGMATPGILLYYAFQENYMGTFLSDPNAQFYLLLAGGLEVAGVLWLAAVSRSPG